MRANDFDCSFDMFLALGMMADQNGEMSGRKESNCVRCRNHGLKIILRGHKQYCPYGACSCDKCRFTAEQQRQMRLQNAIRRAENSAHDRNGTPGRRQRNSSNGAPTMVSPQHQQQQIQQTIQQQVSLQPHQQHIIVTTVASAQPDQRNGGTPHGEKFLLHCSILLPPTETSISIFTFLSPLLRFRREKNLIRLQQRVTEEVPVSLGDDAFDVCSLEVRQWQC